MNRYLKLMITTGFAFGSGTLSYYTGIFKDYVGMEMTTTQAILMASLQGLGFGLCICAASFIINVARERKGIDTSDDELTPVKSFLLTVPINQANDLLIEAMQNLHKIKWRTRNSNKLELKTGMTWRSYGEIVSAELKPVGDQTLIQLSSRPYMSTVKADYGQNSDNLRIIKNALSQSGVFATHETKSFALMANQESQ